MRLPAPPLLVLLCLIGACAQPDPAGPGTDSPAPPPPPPPAPVAVRLEVTPDHLRIPVGESVTLTVRGVAANGATAPVPGGITFASRHPGIAEVTPDGRVTALAVGDAELVARWTGEAATVGVAVLGPPAEVRFSADSVVVAPGFSADFQAVVRDAVGHELDVRLASGDTTLAHVEGNRVEGRRPGTTTVIVEWQGGRGEVPVRVRHLPGVLVMSIGTQGFLPGRELEFLRLDGSGPTTLRAAEPVWGPTISPDGRSVAVLRPPQPMSAPRLGLLDPRSGTIGWLPGTGDAYYDLAWSPDGHHLLYTAFRSWDDTSRVMETSVAGGPPRLLAYGAHARWVIQGSLLAWECGRWLAFDGGSGVCVAGPDALDPAVTHPGRSHAAPSPAGELATVDFLSSPQPVIDLPAGSLRLPVEWVSGMAWSPDGDWLAIAAGTRGGDARAWIVSADGAVRMWRTGRSTVSWGPVLPDS